MDMHSEINFSPSTKTQSEQVCSGRLITAMINHQPYNWDEKFFLYGLSFIIYVFTHLCVYIKPDSGQALNLISVTNEKVMLIATTMTWESLYA